MTQRNKNSCRRWTRVLTIAVLAAAVSGITLTDAVAKEAAPENSGAWLQDVELRERVARDDGSVDYYTTDDKRIRVYPLAQVGIYDCLEHEWADGDGEGSPNRYSTDVRVTGDDIKTPNRCENERR